MPSPPPDPLGSAPPASLRVAVTGVHTHLGRSLLAALEADPACEAILALDVRPPVVAGPKTRYRRLDLTDPAADALAADLLRTEGVDVVVHAAFLAYPSHVRSWAHELEAIGSLYLMNAVADVCHASRDQETTKSIADNTDKRATPRLRRFILCSTTAVYGAHPTNPAFLDESAPLRGVRGSRWVTDRVTVERELERLRRDCPGLVTTSLRFGMTVGPTARNFYTKLLTPTLVPTVMGYDPLVQFLHEDDATHALLHAVLADHPGAFNIVGDGTLYWSDVLRLGGKLPLPVPHVLGYPAATALFNLELSVVPGPFLDYFRYAWVADGRAMHATLGFHPRHTSREAVSAFFAAQTETPAATPREARP
jgi:UDP-glucose 4-epimerase